NAREAVVVDTECNDEYGVVIYIVKPDPIVEIFEMEVNIPYPEWRKSADVPPEDPAPAPAGPMGATERAV
ncbi:MAG: hypothetical protein LBK04_05085, partial [Clostridiales Family XIII bacterium]|nr:hypothetical protein [Clostridiales Family XIII bacterium]